MKITQFSRSNTKNKKGFALTEVLLAIAVIVIIGIAAYPLYKNARTSSEVEAMANDIAILQTNAQTLYTGQSSYNGLTIGLMKGAGLVPDDLGVVDSTSTKGSNSWGGDVTILPNATVGSLVANSGFTIVFTGVPQSACTQLVNRVAPSFLAIGDSTTLNNIKDLTGGVQVANIPTVCVSAGASLAFTAR